MKSTGFTGLKRIAIAMLLVITLGVGAASAQIIEVYNKLGSDVVIKPAVKGADPFFSGIYNEARAWVIFDDFWVEGRVGMNMTTNNLWDTGVIEIMSDKTYGNVGWLPFDGSEIVLGTLYYKTVPGTYMNAYDDALPAGRYGKTGATYLFSGLSPMTGISMGVNVPFQRDMFSDVSFFQVNGAVYYEGTGGLNGGVSYFTNLKNDVTLGAFFSYTGDDPLTWMVGYTYNGYGIDGETPIDHAIDATMKFDMGFFSISADFEIGFNVEEGSNMPIYTGLLGIVYPMPDLALKMSALYIIGDAKDYAMSENLIFLYPRASYYLGPHEFSVGAQVTISDMPVVDTGVGLAFPIFWKYYF